MCGISGFISSHQIEANFYYPAHKYLSHRGMDDEGFIYKKNNKITLAKGDDTISQYQQLNHIKQVSSSNLILGHRRLAIINLNHQGHQPFQFRNLTLVYNGELYNYKTIRQILINKGYEFLTDSDSEVILKSYHFWKEKAFNQWNGMWAIAIYDNDKGEILLSRDRFGSKPLFYCIHEGTYYFASEMKFILAALPYTPQINRKAVLNFIEKSKIANSNETFWENIYELEPAHYTYISHELHISTKRFWNLKPTKNIASKPYATKTFTHLFNEAIQIRLQSDVPIGSLLSGGLDSTGIVSTILNKFWKINNQYFRSFSAVYKEEIFSELKYIKETKKKYENILETNFVTPSINRFDQTLDKLFYHVEYPFRSLSVYSQYEIYKYINQNSNVKVLINGQGADELFAGYTDNYYMYFISLIRTIKIKKLIKEIILLKKNRGTKIIQILIGMLRVIKDQKSIPTFRSQLYNQVHSHPLREYLMYDDRTSMAFGKETRNPFLDYRIVEFAFNLDDNLKIDRNVNKAIIRQSFKEILPYSILNRKDKMGFITPQEKWQRKELGIIIENSIKQKLHLSVINSMSISKKWKQEYNLYKIAKNNNWQKIWRLYNFLEWEDFWTKEKWKMMP